MRTSTISKLNLVAAGLGYPNMERWLHINYVDRVLSMKKCGEMLGVGNKTVSALLTYYRIPVRLAKCKMSVDAGVGMTPEAWRDLSVREIADRIDVSRSKAWRLKQKHTSEASPPAQKPRPSDASVSAARVAAVRVESDDEPCEPDEGS